MRPKTLSTLTRLGRDPLTLAIAAAIGASVAVPAVRAQDVRPAAEADDVIVVTASRRESEIRELPFSVTALSGTELDADRLTSLTEMGRFVPGMTVVDQGARGSDLVSFRGLNVSSLDDSEFLDNTGGGTVATYVGEVPIYLDLQTFDLERVEFLPGPQGTLYGSGTLGGAIRYIPKAPDLDRFSVDVHGGVYTLDQSDDPGFATDAAINAPIVDGKLALRAAYYRLADPGFIDYPHIVLEPGVSNPQPDLNNPADVAANLRRVDDVDSQDINSGRIALLYSPGDRTSATFTYYDQRVESGGRTVNHRASYGTGQYESGHRFLEPENRETSLFSAEIVADLGFAELTSATAFSRYDMEGQRDQTDFYLDQEWGYETFPSFVSYTHELENEKRVNQEFRLVSQGDGRIGWIAGLFYNDFDLDSSSEEYIPGFMTSNLPADWGIPVPPSDLSYYQVNVDNLKEQALYGELTIAATSRLDVIVGGRLFDYDTTQHSQFDIPFWGITDTQDNVAEDDGFLGKLGAAYAFTDRVMGYATLSEGYRIGGANAVPPCPSPVPPAAACALPDEVLIKPDRTKNFELGAHAVLRGGNLSLDGAVYTIDWDDVQTLGTTVNGDLPITVNGSSAESQGLEFSIAGRAAGPWSFRATYAYNQAELTSDAPGLVNGADAFAGDRLSGTPEHMLSFGLGHERELSNGYSLGFGYNASATSDVLTRVGMRNGGEELDGYVVQSLRVSLSRDQWQATLYADNLTNEYAETGVRLEPSSIRSVNGFDVRRYFRNVLRPRTVGVEFRYSFGE